MGVFARLFRRSKTTEEAQEARSPEAEMPQPTATATAEATDAAAAGTAQAEPGSRPADEETARPTADEGIGIPKQQSAKDVADSEADESART
ncbi:hypothetical protein [Streptomyces sp. NPDC007264]|uniref:hypothetical protein n=1 Tax=Streptomyces sp. NPDC007264 TaxID=3364777 RepID=UPI0036D8454B